MAKACKLKSKSPKHQADAQDSLFISVTPLSADLTSRVNFSELQEMLNK
jgi:broad specificity polyphosphatase/5'/3'-nucleotidase SurE